MRRKVLSSVLGLGLLGLVLLGKFVLLPMIEVERKKPIQWSEARPEVRAKIIKPFIAKAFKGINVPKPVMDGLETCVLNRTIAFLTSTDCDYYYAKATTSRSEHEKKQERCLKKAGFEKKLNDITLACAKSKLPNEWSIARDVLLAEMDKGLTAKVPDKAKRKKACDCVVKNILSEMKGHECRPIKTDATKVDSLFKPLIECFKEDPALAKKIKATAAKCVGKASPAGKSPKTDKPN